MYLPIEDTARIMALGETGCSEKFVAMTLTVSLFTFQRELEPYRRQVSLQEGRDLEEIGAHARGTTDLLFH